MYNTKEEAIKAAYGDNYEKYKDDIDFNGYTSLSEDLLGFDFLAEDVEYFDFESSNKWRPAILSGIENNNGWRKITNQKSLPKPNCEEDIWLLSREGGISIASSALLKHADIAAYWIANNIAWQPVSKPELPIYQL
ncbi:MAG TPA: hypothetical protein VF476_01065 [Chitinophagaceae bacterium]